MSTLILVVLAVSGFASTGTASAQSIYLDSSVNELAHRLTQQLKVKQKLGSTRVFVSPLDFFEERSLLNLPLSEALYEQFITELQKWGVPVELSEDDAEGVMVLSGAWRVLSGGEGLRLTVKIRERIGSSHQVVASEDAVIRNVEERLLEPDLDSWGRYLVKKIESGLNGRRDAHFIPFSVEGKGVRKPKELGRYLDRFWLSEAFARSRRRVRLVSANSPSDSELRVSAYVTGKYLQVSLQLLDASGMQVTTAVVRNLAIGLLPRDFLVDVLKLRMECESQLEGGDLKGAWTCYARMLQQDGEDEAALRGREGIEGRYAQRVRAALNLRNIEEADRIVRELARLKPNPARVNELEMEITNTKMRLSEEKMRNMELEKRRTEALRQETLLDLSKGERERVQMGLVGLGYEAELSDENFGERMREAITAWQEQEGMDGTGYLTESQAKTLMAEAKPRVREHFRDCSQCPQMVVVPPGSYRMGSPWSEKGRYDDEDPEHVVTLDEPIAVGVYEVTRGEFGRFVREANYVVSGTCRVWDGEWRERLDLDWHSPGFLQTESHPVVCVSWEDARAYVEWLSSETDEMYWLLSESEWEYIARGGITALRYWGEDPSGQCHYANGADGDAGLAWGVACKDGYPRTSPVGSFAKNDFGLHDVLGNVWEWVQDCWHDSYHRAPNDGSVWERDNCGKRVLRGGSWHSRPRSLRFAVRNWDFAGNRNNVTGFRVARELAP